MWAGCLVSWWLFPLIFAPTRSHQCEQFVFTSEHIDTLVCVFMRARDLSNIMQNDFKDGVLIETVWVLGVAYFPQGPITMAKKKLVFCVLCLLFFVFGLDFAQCIHPLFNWITRGLLTLLQLRNQKPSSLKKSRHLLNYLIRSGKVSLSLFTGHVCDMLVWRVGGEVLLHH